jgi:hypothetical protein
MSHKHTLPGTAMLVRWWSGPPVLVIIPGPPERPVQLCTAKMRGTFQACIPMGPIEAREPTKVEKRFLLSKGMHPGIFRSHRVFSVSSEAAMRFDVDQTTFIQIAKTCGLSQDDLSRIAEAKKRLNAFRPASFSERRAAQGLREFLTPARSKRQRGRPGRITAEDRVSMHNDALQLRRDGKTTQEIVRMLSQRYQLRASYTKRILEDASDTD